MSKSLSSSFFFLKPGAQSCQGAKRDLWLCMETGTSGCPELTYLYPQRSSLLSETGTCPASPAQLSQG